MFLRCCYFVLVVLLAGLCSNCNNSINKKDYQFTALTAEQTGLAFTNTLSHSKNFNLFHYIYFYNGSGVGAGDFNNDGKIDLFFGSNQHQNKIYLNEGGMHFKDVTAAAGLPNDGGWTTGISVVDINNDGLLDVYICRVGNYEVLQSKNLLLINKGLKNGVPYFKDEAAAYGVDFSGFSTQAGFFDYDNDGDLDMYLLNHSVHQNGTFRPRQEFAGTMHPLSGDRIYRNDGGRFTNVTAQTGINSTAIGYGLGLAFGDVNGDGYTDIYVGNDFHENDYLYINQQNGTFKDECATAIMHTSQYSMGVDIGDINNDAWPEIISMDMLPEDPYILKRSLGEDAYDIFQYKISVGYGHQFTRNNLQYNRGNGLFSEVGLYSGVAATDWSWTPLWMDFDGDGLKDLFVSNGIPKRMNDIDYINFVSNTEVQQRIKNNDVGGKDMSLINKFPEIKLPNKFFKNKGNLSFSDESAAVENNGPSFSNGAVYADFDGDGDLDIAVNNIEAPVTIYRNNSAVQNNFLRLQLRGPAANVNAVGSKVVLHAGAEKRVYDYFQTRGFLSSMQEPLLIGTKGARIDSAFVIWPDRTYQAINISDKQTNIICTYKPGLPKFNFTGLMKQVYATAPVTDLTAASGLHFLHKENRFAEFDREPLLPHMLSTEGPALATADVNNDGREDVFVGGARNSSGAVFLQTASGKMQLLPQPALQADSAYEDVAATFVDVNADSFLDLVVASGGNEFYGQDSHNSPRLYLNNGAGIFARKEQAFSNIYSTASVVCAADVNGDGWNDLFIGGRSVPWAYGEVPQSYLLLNNKQGGFVPAPNVLAPGLSTVGFVTDARWTDLDVDGDADLLLSLEWGGISAFINNKGKFSKTELTTQKGWWNFALPADVDGDGDLDIVAGNLGLNSRLKATAQKPVEMYYNDFDGNGKKEQVLTYYVGDRKLPFANKAELEKQMPFLKKKFLFAADFAKASLTDLFDEKKLQAAAKYSADYFANTIFINEGNLKFRPQPLPWQAQLTAYRDAVVVDANGDALPDILLAGNYYDNNIEMGRYDADYGTVLINKGNGNFTCSLLNGISIKGQVRHLAPITLRGKQAWLAACNGDSVRLLQFNAKK